MLRRLIRRIVIGLGLALAFAGPAAAQSGEPIRIGLGMALTGGLAANGKSALLAMQIWAEDQNAKGGLLGRPVALVYYDDQSTPSAVPGIYSKLLDVDKVDLVVSGYATNMVAPAMPIIMQKNRVFMGLFALAVNDEFKYPRYFSILPTGPDPKRAFSDEFFEVAAALEPKPKTVALVGADAEYPHNALAGARDNAKKAGIRIVYDRTYPPGTSDFTPIVRAIQAAGPEVVFVASYPPDSVGMVRAVNEVGLKARLFGGGMVGLQATALKTQLGPQLNGIVNYDFWLPVPKMQFPGVMEFLKKYQARAESAGVDPLGYYMAPWAYVDLQVLAQAVEATRSLDDAKIAEYLHGHTMKTILGDIAFGENGEWSNPRLLLVQFRGVKGNDVGQFRGMDTQAVIAPAEYKSGDVITPFEQARR